MASTTSTNETNNLSAQSSSPSSGGYEAARNLRNRDGFFQGVYQFFDALGKHRAGMLAVLVAVIAACVGAGLWANHRTAENEVAKDALYRAEKAYETELKAMAGVKPPVAAPAKKAPSTDPKVKAEEDKAAAAADKIKREEDAAANKRLDELAFQKMDVDAKFPATIKAYQELLSKHGKSRAGHEARMALGSLYFNHGEPAKAAPVFQAASENASGNFDKAVALQSWGYSLENQGKFAEAVTAYEKASNYGKDSGIQGDVMLALARSYEGMNDAAKARSTYDQILNTLPNSEAAKSAEALKAKLH